MRRRTPRKGVAVWNLMPRSKPMTLLEEVVGVESRQVEAAARRDVTNRRSLTCGARQELVRDYEVRCDASGGAICFGGLAPACAGAALYFSDVGCHVGARLPSIRAYRSVSQLQQCPLGFWLDGVGENYKKLVELL